MKAKERIAQLEAEVADLKERLAWALARIHELEGQAAKNSHNSSQPPSSDGPGRWRVSQRKPSEKPSGGQAEHPGHHLSLVETPDEIIRHRPSHCQHCQHPLAGVEGEVTERRQVQGLPVIRLLVQEHRVEAIRCPQCQLVSRGTFPQEVSASAQYGAGVKALAVYLHQSQLVPLERTVEVLEDLCACCVSEGTLVNWEHEAAHRLEGTVEHIAVLSHLGISIVIKPLIDERNDLLSTAPSLADGKSDSLCGPARQAYLSRNHGCFAQRHLLKEQAHHAFAIPIGGPLVTPHPWEIFHQIGNGLALPCGPLRYVQGGGKAAADRPRERLRDRLPASHWGQEEQCWSRLPAMPGHAQGSRKT